MNKVNKTKSAIIKKALVSSMSIFIAMLLLAYSAYAWFAMSSDITATGMNLNVEASNGLEIATTENGEYSDHINVNLKEVIEGYVSGFDKDTDDFYLMPASSYSGTNLWYTTQSNNVGTSLCNEDEYQKGYGIKFYPASGKYEGHYVDIDFWIRSASPDGCNIKLDSKRTVVTPIGEDGENLKSVVRMAFLTPDGTQSIDGATTPFVYSADTLETSLNVVTDDGTGTSKYTTPNYIKFGADKLSERIICTMDSATYDDSGVTYSKKCVKVRIWIEGQDPKCVAAIGGKEFEATIGLTAV